MMMRPKLALRSGPMTSAMAMAALLLTVDGLAAQTAEQFYTGRTVNVVVPYSPGGYYDIGARLVAGTSANTLSASRISLCRNQPGGRHWPCQSLCVRRRQ